MTTATTIASLTDEERESIYLIGEALIPPAPGMISADEAGVSAKFLDEVLNLRSDLLPEFRRIVSGAAGLDPTEFCERLAAEKNDEFQLLTFVIAGAYFMSPKVRVRLRYRGQIGEVQNGEAQSEYGTGGILDLVRKKGAIYRDAAEGEASSQKAAS